VNPSSKSQVPDAYRRPRWPQWLGLIALIGGLGFWGREHLSLQTLIEQQQALTEWTQRHLWQSALAYLALYVTMAALSLPFAAVLTIAGGALFGLGLGTVLALCAATLGATLAMGLARYFLGDWARRQLGPWHAAFERGMARDGSFYLLSMRLLPVLPFFLVNLAVGLSRMSFVRFATVSLLGMLPATVVYVNAGRTLASAADGIGSADLWVALSLLALLPLAARGLLPWWARRRALSRWWAERPRRFDRNLVVIGAGAGGLVSAYMASTLRARVTLVEADRPGGDCLYRGCVPSKTLIEAARQMAQIQQAQRHGLLLSEPRLQWPVLMRRLQQVTAEIEPHDSIARYTGLGVDVRIGRARIVNPWMVEIQSAHGLERLSTRAIVLATGSKPIRPDIEGLAGVCAHTSDSLWDHLASLHELPHRILVLGAGAMGCELGQALARLGAQVSLVERGDRALPQEEQQLSEVAGDALRGAGVSLYLSSQVLKCQEADQQGAAPYAATVQTPQGLRTLTFDLMILAVGRQPNWRGLGLEELGLQSLELDEHLQTALPGIYAAGDVTGGRPLTHAAAHQGWHAAVNALQGLWSLRPDRVVMPQVLFMDPEIARAGLTRQQAEQQGLDPQLTRVELDELDRAIVDGRRKGYVELITPAGSDRLLGVTLVGAQAGELLPQFTLAMNQGLGLSRVLANVHAYPTWAEAVRLAAAAHRRQHQSAWLLGWLERFHAWRRG